MAWSYSGDPSSSDIDKYRFMLGDTDVDRQLLQDEEINFCLEQYDKHSSRMCQLCSAILNKLAKYPKRSLGPIQEDPTELVSFYERLLKQYKASGGVPSMASPVEASFTKGMHDNV